MKKIKVYIASPYTNGKTSSNVKRQLDAMNILIKNNFVPFAPLINHFAEIYININESEWLNWDLEWLKTCDILIRLRPIIDGKEIKSPGSDIEEKFALENGLLVYNFNTIEELNDWAKTIDKEIFYK